MKPKFCTVTSTLALILLLTACSTHPTIISKTGAHLYQGKQIDLYRSATELNKQSPSRIYLEPIEAAEAIDPAILTRLDSVNYLNKAIIRAIEPRRPGKLSRSSKVNCEN